MNLNPMLEIDAQTLRAWLQDHRPVEVIDIRPRADYESWHIPGSRNVDAYQAIYARSPGPLARYEAPADRPVVAVCYVGQTSKIASQYLRSRGIEALSLAGGMQAWSLAWNTADVPLRRSGAQVIQVRRTGKGCLSYLVASGEEAAVIDPSVEPRVYLELAQERGGRITKVIDTHIHADHLSRSRPLAEATGAAYYLPKQDRSQSDYTPLASDEIIPVGASRLQALETPGHTFESMSFILDDEALFTGDTLFVDSVGRPDLKANPGETERRARALHASLQELTGLDPQLLVLPCHTAKPVPFDGVPIAARLETVLERVEALKYSEEDFTSWILGRIPPNPPNYEHIVLFNEAGRLPELDPSQLEAGANNCAI